jgi:hypothetical protein
MVDVATVVGSACSWLVATGEALEALEWSSPGTTCSALLSASPLQAMSSVNAMTVDAVK